ncbi:MAG: acyltransferase family protein, partial [Mesorhizobium sp.]
MPPISTPTYRFPELESVRGIAAVVVLVHHCLLGFAPMLHGLVDKNPDSLLGTPFFAAINGTAAVVVFFVLSGFVLTYKAIRSQSIQLVLVQGLKRWPRLVGPVLVANMFVAILVMAGLTSYHHSAALLTESHWLDRMYIWAPSGLNEMANAASEGLFGAFFHGQAAYNTALWTMYYELWGSFLALGLALVAIFIPRKPIVWLLFVAAWTGATLVNPYFGCFVVGVGLAFFYASHSNLRIGGRATLAALCVVVLLAGYHEAFYGENLPVKFYSFLAPIAKEHALLLRVCVHSSA